MLPLNRKLIRDLWHMRAQALALALVIGTGAAVLIMSLTTIEALTKTGQAYYDRYRFAQVFARAQRAPDYLRERVAQLPGVQSVSTRVVKSAVINIEGFDEPVISQLVSIPDWHPPELNRLALRSGRLPSPGSSDEAVMSEPFAEAHGLSSGSRVRAVINGKWRDLVIVGIALSPEYVYTIGPGALIPDDKRFGIIWMGQAALQAAFDLDGAFNDISVTLLPGSSEESMVRQLDDMLKPYGGFGAYGRADQQSNWFLRSEIDQLRTLSLVLPGSFLAVAAFLANVLLARLIAMDRSEIGLLKAFGYGNGEIGWHYTKFVLVVSALGMAIGCVAGYAFGKTSTEIYAEYFRFPFLLYEPGPRSFAIATIASTTAALFGGLGAVRAAVRLPPAEAMRPPAPPHFQRGFLTGVSVMSLVDQPTRILLRQLGRWPARSFITSFGIGMAIAVLISSIQWLGAIERLADIHFKQAQGQDLTVGFFELHDAAVERELASLPGVITTEPMRSVAARLRFGSREERQHLIGVPARQNLQRVFDVNARPVDLPPDGLVLSTQLAGMLGARIGDTVTAEVLEGRRPTLHLPVVATFETYIGAPAYLEFGALNKALGDGQALNAVHLRIDSLQETEFFAVLREIPGVGSISVREATIAGYEETLVGILLVFVSFFTAFACALAIGVAYNSARIALSERGRELATLRVLGLTRGEVSYILLGELAMLTFLALPLGCAFGYLITFLWQKAFVSELFRVPFVILPKTYAVSIIITIVATVLAALLVARRLRHLDLIAVLKTRE